MHIMPPCLFTKKFALTGQAVPSLLMLILCLVWQHCTRSWSPCPRDQLPSHGPTTSKPERMGGPGHTGLYTAAGGLHLTPQPEEGLHCCHQQGPASSAVASHLALHTAE